MEIDQLLVKDIMSPPTMTASKDETVADVISRLKKNNIREIPVVDGDKPVGLISYSSFLARRNVPLTAKAEHIMIPCPKLEEEMKVIKAAEELMSRGVRGAPVVRNHRMIGFLSRTDVIKILPQIDQLKGKQVGSFMSSNPQTVFETETVRKAQILMKGLNEKTLPVVDEENNLIGAVGMTEVMEVIWSPKGDKVPHEIMGHRVTAEVTVGSVMSRAPVFISPKDTVEKAVSVMLGKGLTTLFVTEESKLVGVVSQADLLEQVISMKPREGVYVQITGLDLEDPDVYDTLYGLIGKSMERINRMEPPRVFTVHITIYHHEGMKSKYSLGARLTTEKSMYYNKHTDWDLYKAMDTVLDMLEKNIKRDHEKKRDLRKVQQSL
jgi:CBS domain-containing protein/ribosome-associated translation inhibitor RaiA